MRQSVITFLLVAAGLLIAGCSSAQKPESGDTSARGAKAKTVPPDIVVRIASLNLGRYGKRIEENDIALFASTVRRDSIDILCAQGLTRYPDVPTRIDFVDRFAVLAGMWQSF